MKLYTYFRSSAAFRVRIALNLKGIGYEPVFVHLAKGRHRESKYSEVNPQALLPTLELDDGTRLTQSLAIIEWLDEEHPTPPLIPKDPLARARVRSLSYLVASEIHPLNNLRVLQYFERDWGVPQPERDVWVRHWITEGFSAFEALLQDHPSTGAFCDGNAPSIADCCLIPQMYNARRFAVDLTFYPTLLRIEEACLALPEFDAARPERQPDAP